MARDEQGHADRAWALFLAIAAAQTEPVAIAFEVVAHRRDWGLRPDGRDWGHERGQFGGFQS